MSTLINPEPSHARDQAIGMSDNTPMATASPWDAPAPPGVAGALDSTYSVTGPILAGFASSIVALVAPNPESFPVGWLVMDFGILAVGALIFAIQVSFHAKAVWASPSE